MSNSTRSDWDEYDAPPKAPKEKYVRDPFASIEADVRKFVLSSPEEWLAPKFVASALKFGTPHVAKVMKKMAEEGILAPLRLVPMNDEEVKVRLSYEKLSAYPYDGRWVTGYYDKVGRDPKRLMFYPGRPSLHRYSRVRGRTVKRNPTKREWAMALKKFRYELAEWDGKAHAVFRNGQPYVDACVAIGVEPNTDLPWTCECGRVRAPGDDKCRCGKEKPKYIQLAEPKRCPNCGEVTKDNHWRRHRNKGLIRERWSCMQKIVDQVHGR